MAVIDKVIRGTWPLRGVPLYLSCRFSHDGSFVNDGMLATTNFSCACSSYIDSFCRNVLVERAADSLLRLCRPPVQERSGTRRNFR